MDAPEGEEQPQNVNGQEPEPEDTKELPRFNLNSTPPPDDIDSERMTRDLSIQDMFTKDAYLVFRALCKLSMKPLITERHAPFFTFMYAF